MIAGIVTAAGLTAAHPGVALLCASGLAAAAAAVRRLGDVPKWVLLATVAMVPLDALTKIDGTLTIAKLIFPPAVIILATDRIVRPRPFVQCRQCAWVLAFAASVALSLLVHPIGSFALKSATSYTGVLLLFYLTVNVVETERDVRMLLATLIFSCVLSVVLGIAGALFGWLPGGMMIGEHAGRLMGLSSVNPNTFASYLLAAGLVAAYFLLADRRLWMKGLLLAAVLVMGAGIALSLSRAVALVAAVCAALVLFRLRRETSPWQTAIVLAIVALCLVPIVPVQYYERVHSLVDSPEADQSLQSRLSFNRVGLQLFAENPLLGVGPGNFAEQFTSQEFRYMADTFGFWKLIHNVYLSVACELGIVGLVLFAAVIWQAFADLRFVARSAPGGRRDFLTRAAEALGLALFSFVLNAFFLPAEHDKYLWVLVATCAAVAEMRRRQGAGTAAASAVKGCAASATQP